MEKSTRSKLIVATIVTTIVIAAVTVPPRIFRLQIVANHGVQLADTIQGVTTLVAGLVVVLWAIIWASIGVGNFLDARRKKKAPQKTQAVSSFLGRNEIDPSKVITALWQMAEQYGEVPDSELGKLITKCNEQLTKVQKIAQNINKIFDANSEEYIEGEEAYGYTGYHSLLQKLLDGMCLNINGVIYQALAGAPLDQAKKALYDYVSEHEEQVKLAAKSAQDIVRTLGPNGDRNTITQQFKEFSHKLETTLQIWKEVK